MIDIYNSGGMQGTTWYHPRTGAKFTIKDMAFDASGEVQVFTTDGRILSASVMSEYIQSDKPLGSISKVPPMPKIDLSGLDEETPLTPVNPEPMFDHSLKDIPSPVTKTTPTLAPIQEDELIISKALKKLVLPEIQNQYVWSQYPETEINMLVDIMDIDKGAIIDYIVKKTFENGFIEKVKDEYKKFVRSKIIGEEVLETVADEVPVFQESRVQETRIVSDEDEVPEIIAEEKTK